MKLFKSIIAGLAGAAALNILHETVRQFDDEAPRIDLLGGEAITHLTSALGLSAPAGDNLYKTTLAGDIISNTAYYSMIGMGDKKSLAFRAVSLGLSAGLGALKLPEPMGLDDEPVAGTDKKKLMTVGYYVFGALVTAGVFKMLDGK